MARHENGLEEQDLFSEMQAYAQAERQTFRRSLAIAVAVHAVLLLITLPEVYPTDQLPEPAPQKVYVVQVPRFRPPEPQPAEPIRMQERRQLLPMPDLTPDEPEVVPLAIPEAALDLANVDDVFLHAIPDAPPAPVQNGPYEVGGQVLAPVRTVYVAPEYTELARRARIQGAVMVKAVIDRHGNVTDVQVLKGLNFGLTEAAVEAAKQWKYKPSTLNGKPVDVYLSLSVQFKLQ